MKKRLLLLNIVMVSAFFLVFLGVRNTSLDHNPGPKPRPRAVVEKSVKAPMAFSCEQQIDAELSASVPETALPERRQFYQLVVGQTPHIYRYFVPSRASPRLIS